MKSISLQPQHSGPRLFCRIFNVDVIYPENCSYMKLSSQGVLGPDRGEWLILGCKLLNKLMKSNIREKEHKVAQYTKVSS